MDAGASRRSGLMGTKEAVVYECGACTVILNGKPSQAPVLLAKCRMPILTIEGMRDDEIGRVIQECFVEGDAVQCGFCTPGFIMSAYALLMENLTYTDDPHAIAGNLCRCTGYIRSQMLSRRRPKHWK